MAKEVRRLYRSDDKIIAGVCSGIAEYCDIDPVIVRILAVLLSISSFGAMVIVYVLLWLVMPRRLSTGDPISCDAFVRVQTPVDAAPRRRAPDGSRPIPPVGHQAWGEYVNATQDETHRSAYAAHYEAVSRMGAQEAAHREARAGMSGATRVVVWLGVVLLFVGVAALFSNLVEEFQWWQLWPFLVVLAGLVEMVVPSRRASRVRRFSRGLVLFALGVVLLLVTTHLLSWRIFPLMFQNLWPLLFIALGIDIISRAMENEVLALVAALCVVGMLVCAATVYAIPGPLDQLTMHSPLLDSRVLDSNPWD